jgi:membrane complex biogenesis BtpA family protein
MFMGSSSANVSHAPRNALFSRALIGMVHVGALPSTPHAKHSLTLLCEHAIAEAKVLVDAGYDGIIVENMHDRPYVNPPHDAAVIAGMTMLVQAVRESVPQRVHVGVQVLSRGEKEALAIAHVTGCQFIRCENFVFAHVADEGLLADAAAGPLLRYRRSLGADNIHVFADVQKKHASHSITADTTLADLIHGAQFFCADGVIVTGTTTGKPTDPLDVKVARGATSLPVLVGSGVTPPQVKGLLEHADGLIVGSYIKKGGVWDAPIDAQRAVEIVKARGG